MASQDMDMAEDDGLMMEMDEATHEEYQENFQDFMSDIQNHVKQLATESSRAPQDAYEAFQGKLTTLTVVVYYNLMLEQS